MAKLIQGQVTDEEFNLLLKLTKIKGESKVEALWLHLVRGYRSSMAYQSCGLKQSKFAPALATMNEKWDIHLKLIDASLAASNKKS
ncbi:PapB/FocB family fimbrial expression transcriptional regulator [Shewanella frigidimarina]|uniref:PapB/FocB family fimbrial expression transcriptional regulator n=1 Tax=Shewanella frigidimarina TaxID=56812 RepID=UPI003D7B1D51